MRTIVLSIFVFLLFCSTGYAQDYSIDFPHPETHYAHVTATFKKWKGGNLEIHMPVWAPGSYLVREFSKSVESFKAFDTNGKQLKSVKTRKMYGPYQLIKVM